MRVLNVPGRIYRLVLAVRMDLDTSSLEGARVDFGSLTEAEAFLRRTAAVDPSNASVLRRAVAEFLLPSSLERYEDQQIVRMLAQAIVRGRVWVVAQSKPPLSGFSWPEAEAESLPMASPPPARSEEPTRTWIEIELLGEDDRPIAGERYRIKLTDGSIQTGVLNELGRARYDGIDPGVCVVWFPELAGNVWGRVPTGEEQGGDEGDSFVREVPGKTWVEIVLLGEDDEPIPGERYEIRFPGGRVEEGVLDEFGSAFYDDVPPGTCYVSFPNLAPKCWEKL